jgi:hypothetical protein
MSKRQTKLTKAQNLVSEVENNYNILLVEYTRAELEDLKDQLEAFLETGVDPEDIVVDSGFDDDPLVEDYSDEEEGDSYGNC